MHKEIKIHPRQSCLLKMALGKRSLSGGNKAWLPWKRAGLCPLFLYSYDICAMPWRTSWVIRGRLFYLSPGLQNMSLDMELSGTSWSGFTTLYKSSCSFCAVGCVLLSQFSGRYEAWESDYYVCQQIYCLTFDHRTYKHPPGQKNGKHSMNHNAQHQCRPSP